MNIRLIKFRGPQRNLMLGALTVLMLTAAFAWFARGPVKVAGPPSVPPEVPVETTIVARDNVPVYLEGLGNVQGFFTANVTARVDGELQRVVFVEGEMVKRGQLLAQIDPRPNQAGLDQAIATEAKDAAQLDSAKNDLDRYVQLAPQNLISKQTLGQQQALVAQLQAQLKIDRALSDNARTQLDYTRIVSPIDGRTGIRKVDPGNNVHATDTSGIVVVTQMQPIAIVFTLPEDDLLAVKRAMATGAVKVTALSRDDQTELDSGTLSLIDNQIDPSTATMRLKAVFANALNELWPGQFVNVRLLVRQQQGVMTLPSAAIQQGPDGLFTYVVRNDSTVEVRPLKTGSDSEGLVVVTEGLEAGERVVVSNQYRLRPGTRVRLRSAEKAGVTGAAPPLARTAT
jgi:multidrug efflux system membrane fusion protein